VHAGEILRLSQGHKLLLAYLLIAFWFDFHVKKSFLYPILLLNLFVYGKGPRLVVRSIGYARHRLLSLLTGSPLYFLPESW